MNDPVAFQGILDSENKGTLNQVFGCQVATKEASESKGLQLEAIWMWRKRNLPCESETLLKARSEVQTRSLTGYHNIMIKSVKGRRQVWLWIPQRPRSVTTAQTETSSREEMGCTATIFFFQEFLTCI